ncbi:MAG: histidine kinase [Sandaracinus sp.]|nr:histidine kinase [Sandaracinus sp.]|tara:strand:- start:113 stop:517 length:405 start_codon:yes stop_codon:yes gene_type:complete
MATKGPKLLSGGNPQIPKGDGPEPVRAYLAAMPGWKGEVGQALHALVLAEVPGVQQAVRWNSPFYGVEGQGWFLSFHCFTKYVKVTFFAGAELDPPPPETSSKAEVRYAHLREGEARWRSWIRQAAALPGDPLF